MKKIGLTQRVEVVASYQERRDCLDQSWFELLLKLDYMPIPLPNIQNKKIIASYLTSLDLAGVILTGGNDLMCTESSNVAFERDQFEAAVMDFFIEQKKPILGVCRGMQMINQYFGGEMIAVDKHVTSSHQVKLTDGSVHHVNSYHNWGISPEQLANALTAYGHSDDGLVEYCRHNSLAVTGMMWHPERTNLDFEIGQQIIKETFL